jgi:hypothetical protein
MPFHHLARSNKSQNVNTMRACADFSSLQNFAELGPSYRQVGLDSNQRPRVWKPIFSPLNYRPKKKERGGLVCSPRSKRACHTNNLRGRASCTSRREVDAIGLQARCTEPLVRAGRRFYL